MNFVPFIYLPKNNLINRINYLILKSGIFLKETVIFFSKALIKEELILK